MDLAIQTSKGYVFVIPHPQLKEHEFSWNCRKKKNWASEEPETCSQNITDLGYENQENCMAHQKRSYESTAGNFSEHNLH